MPTEAAGAGPARPRPPTPARPTTTPATCGSPQGRTVTPTGREHASSQGPSPSVSDTRVAEVPFGEPTQLRQEAERGRGHLQEPSERPSPAQPPCTAPRAGLEGAGRSASARHYLIPSAPDTPSGAPVAPSEEIPDPVAPLPPPPSPDPCRGPTPRPAPSSLPDEDAGARGQLQRWRPRSTGSDTGSTRG